ncbi:glycoside hydrolase family 113 [Solibacillus ferritrahens]|uniref:glycoside hydrolase family 113 n=1 Tax=Solibacillus ferritrahens TaxID=3098620 RepID=UPI00300AD8C9
MLNKKLIIGTLFVTLLLLLAIFVGKDRFSKQEDEDSKLSIKETSEMEISPLKESERNEERPQLKYTSNEFQAGMNLLIYGHPDMAEARKIFERIRNLGINSVAINFPFYQSDSQANEVTVSQAYTPTIQELRKIIEFAHASELSVMIRPIMDEQVFLSSNMWRGQIKPTDPDSWFDSYQALILTYATLAETTNAKSLNIGTELNSMQNKYQDRWTELIEIVRGVYKGELLYSFNYDTVSEIPSLEFVKLLDQVGIDAYFPLDLPDGATTNMLEEEWKNQINQLEEALWQQTIIVTEVGIHPIAGAYRTPYSWSFPDGTFDPQSQVNYYEATYNTWKPKAEGIYWWAITLGQDPNEISFSPLGLPTEEVIKKHFLKNH